MEFEFVANKDFVFKGWERDLLSSATSFFTTEFWNTLALKWSCRVTSLNGSCLLYVTGKLWPHPWKLGGSTGTNICAVFGLAWFGFVWGTHAARLLCYSVSLRAKETFLAESKIVRVWRVLNPGLPCASGSFPLSTIPVFQEHPLERRCRHLVSKCLCCISLPEQLLQERQSANHMMVCRGIQTYDSGSSLFKWQKGCVRRQALFCEQWVLESNYFPFSEIQPRNLKVKVKGTWLKCQEPIL